MAGKDLRGWMPAALTSARERAGLSRPELARRVRVSPTSVRNWESGRSKPSPSNLSHVCQALGIQPDTLVSVPQDAEHLADLRIRRGLSQADLATEIALSESTVGDIERGAVQTVAPDVIDRIARALDTPPGRVQRALERARHH